MAGSSFPFMGPAGDDWRHRFAWIAVAVWATSWLMFYLFGADQRERSIIWNTAALGLGAATVSLIGGSLWAWALLGAGRLRGAGFALTLAAAIMPPFLYVSAWDAAFGKLGWLTSLFGGPYQAVLAGWPAGIWISGAAAAPAVALIIALYLWQSGRRYEEAALLDGTAWQVFWRVTIVRLRPVLLLCVVWTFIMATREIAVSDLFQLGTLSEQIYLGFALDRPEQLFVLWPASGERNSLLIVVVMVAGMAVLMVGSLVAWSRGGPSGSAWRQKQSTLAPGSWGALAGIAIASCFVAIPVINLLLRAGQQVVEVDGQLHLQFAWSHLLQTMPLAWQTAAREVSISLIIGGAAACATVASAIVFAWCGYRNTLGFVNMVAVTSVLFALPGPLIGYLLFDLTMYPWPAAIQYILDRTLFLPILATALSHLPMATLLCWYLMQQTPRELFERGAIEGFGWWGQLTQVFCRAHRLNLLGLTLLVGVLSIGELSASWIVLPPGQDSLPRLMLGLMHAGVENITAAIGLFLVAGLGILGLLAASLLCPSALRRMP